jgi:hypothetical protein
LVANFVKEYKTDNKSLPDIKHARTEKWYLAIAEGLWCACSKGKMSMGLGGLCLKPNNTLFLQRNSIAVKRDYYYGRHTNDHIRNRLDPIDDTTGERQHKAHIFIPVDKHTKSLNVAAAKISSLRIVPKTVAIDDLSMGEKKKMANKAAIYATPQYQELMKEVGYSPQDAMGVQSANDVEAIEQMGGIRLEAEIQLKNAVEQTFIDSDLQGSLKSQFIDDLFVDKTMCATVEVSPHTGRPIVKYVDIANCFFSTSAYNDHRDIDKAGYWSSISVSELRAHFQREADKGRTKFKGKVEQEVVKVCQLYSNHNGNDYNFANHNPAESVEHYREHGYYPYDHLTIQVATFWIVASDVNTYIKGVTDEGGHEFRRVKNSVSEVEGKEVVKKTTQNVYRVRWVIGTGYVFDYGVDDVLVREGSAGNKTAKLPFIAFRSPKPSLMDRAIELIDKINTYEAKIKMGIERIKVAPIYADLSKMQETLRIGGTDWDILQILGYYDKKEILFYKSKNEYGEDVDGAALNAPIQFMQDPSVQNVLGISNAQALAVQELKEVIGINDITDGSQTSPELLNGVVNAQNQASVNALKDESDALYTFYNCIGKMVMRKYEAMIQAGETIGGVYFSDNVQKSYKLSPDLLSETAEFAFHLEIAPTYEDRQDYNALLQKAIIAGEIGTEEIVTVQNLMRNDDYKAVEYYLGKASRQRKQQEHQRAMELTQGQAQAQGAASEQMEKAKMEAQIAIDNNKFMHEMQLLKEKYKLEAQLQSSGHVQTKDRNNQQADNDLINQSMSAQETGAVI